MHKAHLRVATKTQVNLWLGPVNVEWFSRFTGVLWLPYAKAYWLECEGILYPLCVYSLSHIFTIRMVPFDHFHQTTTLDPRDLKEGITYIICMNPIINCQSLITRCPILSSTADCNPPGYNVRWLLRVSLWWLFGWLAPVKNNPGSQ